jgi:hypothetical protein
MGVDWHSSGITTSVIGALKRGLNPRARFSFALGGKDRHQFPVSLKTCDESLAALPGALDPAKVADTEK